jgi:porin
MRTRLLERGVRFDFQYISDTLWGSKSQQKEQSASWNRFRGTVDIDFGALGRSAVLASHMQFRAREYLVPAKEVPCR